MSKPEAYLPSVDGFAYYSAANGDPCEEEVHALFTDDFAAPSHCLVIKVTTETGRW